MTDVLEVIVPLAPGLVQIVLPVNESAVGDAFTFTVTFWVLEQPFAVVVIA